MQVALHIQARPLPGKHVQSDVKVIYAPLERMVVYSKTQKDLRNYAILPKHIRTRLHHRIPESIFFFFFAS